jgi:hypothetical protein
MPQIVTHKNNSYFEEIIYLLHTLLLRLQTPQNLYIAIFHVEIALCIFFLLHPLFSLQKRQ